MTSYVDQSHDMSMLCHFNTNSSLSAVKTRLNYSYSYYCDSLSVIDAVRSAFVTTFCTYESGLIRPVIGYYR